MTATATREKPVLFSGSLIPPLMDGCKTQTRRLIGLDTLRRSETPGYDWTWRGQAPVRSIAQQKRKPGGCWQDVRHEKFLSLLPYQVGDVLYVRETCSIGTCLNDPYGMASFGDGDFRMHPSAPEASDRWCRMWKKTPSIHMPKWAARIWLEVTDVRVQRLQDISEEDALAEGCEGGWEPVYYTDGSLSRDVYWQGAREAFSKLWDSLSPAGAKWADNPFIAAYTFRKVER